MSDYESDFDSDTAAPATPRAAPPATREEQAMAMYKSAFDQKLLPKMKTTRTTKERSHPPTNSNSNSMPNLPQHHPHHQQTPRACYGSNTVATQTNDTWLPALIQKIVSQRIREEKNRREKEASLKIRSKNQEEENGEKAGQDNHEDNHDLDGLVIESDQTRQPVISTTQHQHCMPPSLSHETSSTTTIHNKIKFEAASLDEFLASSPFPFHRQSNNSSMTPTSVISVARQHRLDRLNSSVYRRHKRGRNSGGRKSGGSGSSGTTNKKLSERSRIKKLLKNIRRVVNQNREGSIEIFHQCEARSGGGSGTLGLLDLRSCLKKLHLQCTIDECKRVVRSMRTRVSDSFNTMNYFVLLRAVRTKMYPSEEMIDLALGLIEPRKSAAVVLPLPRLRRVQPAAVLQEEGEAGASGSDVSRSDVSRSDVSRSDVRAVRKKRERKTYKEQQVEWEKEAKMHAEKRKQEAAVGAAATKGRKYEKKETRIERRRRRKDVVIESEPTSKKRVCSPNQEEEERVKAEEGVKAEKEEVVMAEKEEEVEEESLSASFGELMEQEERLCRIERAMESSDGANREDGGDMPSKRSGRIILACDDDQGSGGPRPPAAVQSSSSSATPTASPLPCVPSPESKQPNFMGAMMSSESEEEEKEEGEVGEVGEVENSVVTTQNKYDKEDEEEEEEEDDEEEDEVPTFVPTSFHNVKQHEQKTLAKDDWFREMTDMMSPELSDSEEEEMDAVVDDLENEKGVDASENEKHHRNLFSVNRTTRTTIEEKRIPLVLQEVSVFKKPPMMMQRQKKKKYY